MMIDGWTSDNLISREALKKHITDLFEEEEKIDKKWAMGLKYSLKIIDKAPTIKTFTLVDIEEQYRKGLEKGLSEWETERPQGKWIEIDGIVIKARCSNCRKSMITEPFGKTDFCPNCGADMREADNEIYS